MFVKSDAQNTADTDRAIALLAKAQEVNAPESVTTLPYHITGKFQLFDMLGAPAGDGTLELYWDGLSRSSHSLTLNHITQTVISDHGTYTSAESVHAPYALRRVIEEFLHPLPELDATSKLNIKIKPANLSGIAADCIVLQATAIPAASALSPANVFCLSSQNQTLRYTALPPNFSILFNHLEAFGTKMFAHDLSFNQGEAVRAKLHFDSFAPWTPDDAIFKHGPGNFEDLPASSTSGKGGVIQGKILVKEPPVYPSLARSARVTGTVVIAAVITRAGLVEDAEVISSASPMLNQAALDAVKKWRYSPYLLNGRPIEIESLLTVNFTMASPK